MRLMGCQVPPALREIPPIMITSTATMTFESRFRSSNQFTALSYNHSHEELTLSCSIYYTKKHPDQFNPAHSYVERSPTLES